MWTAPGTARAARPAHAPPAQHAHPGANDSDDDEPSTTAASATPATFQPTEIVNEIVDAPTESTDAS